MLQYRHTSYIYLTLVLLFLFASFPSLVQFPFFVLRVWISRLRRVDDSLRNVATRKVKI